MNANSNKDDLYFTLFACCIPVSGAKKSIVCDLQRRNFIKIPNSLYYILNNYRNKKTGWIKKQFDKQHQETISEYFDQLANAEFGFFSDSQREFPKLNLESQYDSKLISNAIIDYAENSNYDIKNTICQLSDLFCEALEVRLYSEKTNQFIEQLMSYTEYTTLRSVQLLVKNSKEINDFFLIDLLQKFPRLKIIFVHGASEDRVIEEDDTLIYYTTDIIASESCCGIVDPVYFSINAKTFIEAKEFNSCLNKKISVDSNGQIKNCPSMDISFGCIDDVSLVDALNELGFKKLWNVNKDQIEICSDCEYRYICQDCRAYTLDNSNLYSKPAKCNYDPYND